MAARIHYPTLRTRSLRRAETEEEDVESCVFFVCVQEKAGKWWKFGVSGRGEAESDSGSDEREYGDAVA